MPVQLSLWWPRLLWVRDRIILDMRFTWGWDATYLLDGGDQLDWNKGGGLGAMPLPWHGGMNNKVMVCWRWAPAKQLFEAGIYWHPVGGGRVMPEDYGGVISVVPGEELRVRMEGRRGQPIEAIAAAGTRVASVSCAGTCVRRLMRLTVPWFGGNRTPPRTVTYERNVVVIQK